MKKLLLILCCLALLFGCGSKTNDVGDGDADNNIQNSKGNQSENIYKENVENKTNFDSYEFYTGIQSDEKCWYINIPYLNEINLGKVYMLANGDKWWIGIVRSFDSIECTEDELLNTVFDMYFKGVNRYFTVDEKGFVESISKSEKHSGIDTIKVEGFATEKEYDIGDSWVYGYIFMLGDKPAGIIGMTDKDNSDESKADIKMYIDAMVDTLVLK